MEKNTNLEKLKVFSVFSIVWAHHFQQPLTKYFFSFHVPLLFFVSGIWLSDLFKADFNKFLKAALRRILFPYFIFSILLYIVWFVLIYLSGAAGGKGLSPLTNFIGIFYAQGMNEYMDWGMHMWIFPCVFVVTLIAYFIIKIEDNRLLFWGTTFALFAIGLTLHSYIIPLFLGKKEILMPWSIDASFVGVLFFITGLKLKDFTVPRNSLLLHIIILLLLLATGAVLQRLNLWVDLKNHIYGNLLLFSISAFCSVLFFFLLCRLIPYLRLLTFIGESAILVFVFHLRVWTVFNLFREKIFPSFTDTGLLNTLIFSLIQIGIVLIGVYLLKITGLNKKLSWFYKE